MQKIFSQIDFLRRPSQFYIIANIFVQDMLRPKGMITDQQASVLVQIESI